MNVLLDTCIIIDILNKKNESINLFQSFSEKPNISIITVSEIFAGIRNNKEKDEFNFLLQFLEVINIDYEIAQMAGKLKKEFYPSHHTDLIDSLIASTSIEKDISLYTLNVKHFPMIQDLQKAY